MDWETFLRETVEGRFLTRELRDDDRDFRSDDDNYRRWLAHVIDALARRGRAYELHEQERQWAERAVADGALAWAPDDFALEPAGTWPLTTATRTPPTVEETWLEAVLSYLLGAPGRVYEIAPAELTLAAGAVRERRLEWAVPDESVRLPGGARVGGAGPYR